MLSRKNYRNFKLAAITIEIGLSLALALVVLFSLLALFSDNLDAMAKGGINNLFNRDNSTNRDNLATKTAWVPSGNDPTRTQINVAIVGSQGLTLVTLDDYVNNAQATINKYKDRNDLTPTEIEDLAKAITILGVKAYSDNPINISSLPEPGLRGKYVIRINFNSTDATGSQVGITKVNNSIITYKSPLNVDPLTSVKDVSSKKF